MATIKTGFIKGKVNGITINSSLKCNSKNYNNRTSRDIKYIVMHYTGNTKDTAKANANYFKTGSRRASAHLFVDNTTIYQSVELRDIAWHCGTNGTYYHSKCRNANSIGIEMCCSGNYKISETTKENAAYLCADMCKRLGIAANEVDTYVLRHYDITHKNCPAQMVKDKKEWQAFKDTVKTILTTGTTNKELDTEEQKLKPYLVKVVPKVLNVREGAGDKYKVVTTVKKNEIYTIVEEKVVDGLTWGKLKSGVGWISLRKTEKV